MCFSAYISLFYAQERSFYIKEVHVDSQKGQRVLRSENKAQQTAPPLCTCPLLCPAPSAPPRPSAPARPWLRRRRWGPFLQAVTIIFLSNLLIVLPLD